MKVEQKCDIVIAMLEDINANKKQSQIDLAKIETLTVMMQRGIDQTSDNSALLKEVIEEARKPVVRERRITIDFVSKEVTFLLIGMLIIIAGLSSWLYFATRPNYDRIDNDLKYRYIKMKGEASSGRISELEDIFEINRDNTKIRQMQKDVEAYERAIQAKATLEEQARLRQLEAEKLNDKAKTLKEK